MKLLMMERWIWVVPVVISTVYFCVVSSYTTSMPVHSTGRLPCKHNVSSNDFRRVKWYLDGHHALVSWDNISRPIVTNNYGIDKDFSLVIYNISIEDKGLYRCHITRNVQPISKIYDVKLNVYALPSKAPLIQRVNQTFIICSVDRVYPLLYPHLEFEHEEYAVSNTDGTYNTSVSRSIQNISSESKAVSCSFPHFNYSHVSSLSLYPSTIPYGKGDEQYPTTDSGSLSPEPPNQRGKVDKIVLWLVLTTLFILAVVTVIAIFLLLRKHTNRSHAPLPTESTSPERNGMLQASYVDHTPA